MLFRYSAKEAALCTYAPYMDAQKRLIYVQSQPIDPKRIKGVVYVPLRNIKRVCSKYYL